MMTSFLILWTEVSFSSQFSSCYSYFLEFRVPERSHRFSEFKHKMMVFTSGHLKKFNAFALSSPHWIVSILITPLCLFLLACNEADEMWQHKKAKRIITFESLNGIWGRKQTHHFPYIPIEHFVLGTSSNWGPCCFSNFLPSLGSMLTWAHSLCLLSIYLLFSQIIPSTTSQ